MHVSCHGGCRVLWMLATGRPWSQAEHTHFPPAFKAAVRTLLLAQRRGSVVVESLANPQALLPPDVLLSVIRTAAFPCRPGHQPSKS